MISQSEEQSKENIVTFINQYNNQLVEANREIPLLDYCKELHRRFYSNLDISFMDRFLEFVTKDEICINGNILFELGVLTMKNDGRKQDNNKIKDHLKNKSLCDLKENIDWKIARSSGHDFHKLDVYMFSPRALKLILIRCQNTYTFASYYIFLEECIYYYNQYQLKFKDSTIKRIEKNTELLLQELREERLQAEKDRKHFDEYRRAAEESRIQNHEELESMKEILLDTNEKLDRATDDRVPKSKSITKLEYLIIRKTNSKTEKYKYYIIKCQRQAITERINAYSQYNIELLRIEYCPNAGNLYTRIKERLKDNIDYSYSKLNLINITEKEFIKKVNEINDEKKLVN